MITETNTYSTGFVCKGCGAASPVGIGYAGEPDRETPAADCPNPHFTPAEVRFTAKRACVWSNACHRWITISRERAEHMIAFEGATLLKDGEWI